MKIPSSFGSELTLSPVTSRARGSAEIPFLSFWRGLPTGNEDCLRECSTKYTDVAGWIDKQPKPWKERIRFGFRSLENYRIRALLYAGKPNWRVLGSIVVR